MVAAPDRVREFADLARAKGGPIAKDRAHVESNVSRTLGVPEPHPWTRDLVQPPLIAFAHHEKLDGSRASR